MKKSLIICLAIAGTMFANACTENTISFQCKDGDKKCNKENNIDVCYQCQEVQGGAYWIKKICKLEADTNENVCGEDKCKYGVKYDSDKAIYECECPSFCINGCDKEMGTCNHAIDNCILNEWEDDGSCKKVDGCVNGWNEDGACKEVGGCFIGNDELGKCEKAKNCITGNWNDDGSCKGCALGNNEDGSCKLAEDCYITDENGDGLHEQDGSCKKAEVCETGDWNKDGSCKGCALGNNENGSCKLAEDCYIKDENGDGLHEQDGSCKKTENCLIGNEQDGSCKNIQGCYEIEGNDENNEEDGSCKKAVGCEDWNLDGSCKECINGWDNYGKCACPDECNEQCEKNGACICQTSCVADNGSQCDVHNGKCTCPSKCDAGCLENGMCWQPQSCLKDEDCNVYDYCVGDNCYCTGENFCSRKDKNLNHMHDKFETLSINDRNNGSCRVDKDCDSSTGSGDGFCDSFMDYKCSTKCKEGQCLDGFICRGDGRCAADSFTTVWSSELRNNTLEFHVSSKDAGVYMCWDWNEIDKDKDDYCTVVECICNTEECKFKDLKITKPELFHEPTEKELDDYPELKWAFCPVPFEYISEATLDENQKKYTRYIIQHNYKENSDYHSADKTNITVKIYGELDGFSVSDSGSFRVCNLKDGYRYFSINYYKNDTVPYIRSDCFKSPGISNDQSTVLLSIACDDCDNKETCKCKHLINFPDDPIERDKYFKDFKIDEIINDFSDNYDSYCEKNCQNDPNPNECISNCTNACDDKCRSDIKNLWNKHKLDTTKETEPKTINYDFWGAGSLYYPGPSRSNLLKIDSFGRSGFGWHEEDKAESFYSIKYYRGAFQDCFRLMDLSTIDIPDSRQNKIDMTSMFRGNCLLNVPLDHWDVSNVISMSRTFMLNNCQPSTGGGAYMGNINYPAFNSSLNKWNVSNVKTMVNMFGGAPFDKPINDWDVSSVQDMAGMFGTNDDKYLYSHFNQPINKWNVKNVRRMSDMFLNAKYFDQNLSKWSDKLSNVNVVSNMFKGTTNFYQNLSDWSVSKKEHVDMFKDSAMQENCTYWPSDIQNSCN